MNARNALISLGTLFFWLAALAAPAFASNPADPLDPMYRPHPKAPQTTPPNVWVTDGLAKVHTNDPPGTLQTIQFSAARNEFESFQVHIQAVTNPIQLDVTVNDFVDSISGTVIPAATNVFIYREAYLNITQLSDVYGRLGVTPDPLVPKVDPYFHQARNAFPETIPVGETRSAWIDVLVPATAPSGYYTSMVTVTDSGNVIAQLPATLKVWNFGLPSTATLHSSFAVWWDGFCVQAYGSYFGCHQYPGSGGSDDGGVEQTHVAEAQFLLDHRISLSDVVYVGPPSISWAHFDSTYGGLLNGKAGTLLFGAKLTNLEYVVVNPYNTQTIQDWVAHFSVNKWLPKLFQYTCDEPPNGCSWTQALQEVQFVYNASPKMPTMITTDITQAGQHQLLPDLSILTPNVGSMEPYGGVNQRSLYNTWLKGTNKHLWWYQSCSQHGSCANGIKGGNTSTYPSYMIDATPVRNRVFQWLAFLDKISSELYYLADNCWKVTGSCNSADPWKSVYAFGGNGDGTLFYPGTVDRIGGTTPSPISSIRLKLIRDGMEDYEYLKALSKLGQGTFAKKTAHSFITNAYKFNNDPAALAAAREQLGNQLHALSLQAGNTAKQ
jgi:Glycoside hydrolase 123, catalytic domain